jgi:hypothetical protein
MKTRADRHREFMRGCLLALLLVVAIYTMNAGRLLVPYWANHAKWKRQQIDSYEMLVDVDAYGVPEFEETRLVVSDGEVISAEDCYPGSPQSQDCEYVPISTLSVNGLNRLTVQGLFHEILYCAQYFPLAICGVKYNRDYGYPEHISIGSTVGPHGGSTTKVLSFEPLD